MTRVTSVIAAALAAFAMATACGAGNDSGADSAPAHADDSGGDDRAAPLTVAGEAADGEGDGGSASGDGGSLVAAALQNAAGRDIIHTVTVSIETDDVVAGAARAATIAVAAGGFVADESTRGNDYAHLTLRIPVEAHSDALGDLEALGDVVDRTRTAEDVTNRMVDAESRIDSQRASIARTRQLLESATDMDQIIRIEDELSRREADLDALLRTREELSALSTLATVEVTFGASIDTEPEQAAGFLAGLREGWDAFARALAVGATILGAALPFLLTAAVIAVPIQRWRRRHRPQPAVAQSSAPTA